MDKRKSVHKITLRNKKGTKGKISVGANVEVLLDGKPIKGASAIRIDVTAKSVAKVQIELYAEVDSELYSKLKTTDKEKTGFVNAGTGKHFTKYSLSSYAPTAIALRKS